MNANGSIQIKSAGEISQTVSYAAEELGKYIDLMSRSGKLNITVGLFSDLGVVPKEKADSFDDEIFINVSNGTGIIGGLNPRSVLLAVYRFLTEAGCRWVRPGKDGENIPVRDLQGISVKLQERAAYRHRGICIEGANSNRNILDMIEWLPKMGFNAYFIQFREAFTFYNTWYTHRNNPLLTPEAFSIEKAREYVAQAIKEIKKRDLIYHAVGHGWTCEPIGIPGLGWDKQEEELPPETAKYLALVNGKRQLWQGIALNTNLCYSNPEVKCMIVDDIVQYIEKHEEIDVLHFWLGDGANNQCECEGCNNTLPSEFYVQMLNELDRILTQKSNNTKIVFLTYVDLLWAPDKERINNPDRFILMFAPITRTYTSSFSSENPLPEPEKYVRNKLKFPSTVEENLAALGTWQNIFTGDSFDFDYHLMWDQVLEPGTYKTAEVLHADVRNLKSIGLNGLMSCQVQRVFYPSALAMYTMGRSLWDTGLEFEAIAEDYFTSAFGSEGLSCMQYLKGLSLLFDAPYLRGEKPRVNSEHATQFRSIPEYIASFRDTIKRNIDANSDSVCIARSWEYLLVHADMCVIYSRMLEASAMGNEEKAIEYKEKLFDFVYKAEESIQPVFDLYLFVHTINSRLFKRMFS